MLLVCGHIPSCRSRYWCLACLALSVLGSGTIRAQLLQPGVIQARSRSGQFLIQSMPASGPFREVAELESNTNFVRLDPTLLPVSSERIKQLVWHELNAADNWSGKIFLKLYPASSAQDTITISSDQFRDRWQYGVELPSVVERSRYARALVGVLLLEFANRNAVTHSAELPTWLVEGLSEQLMATSEDEIILAPPRDSGAVIKLSSFVVNTRRANPLERAHRDLSSRLPLTFEQLSWPPADLLSGQQARQYRSSAQLFVDELIALPEGGTCLREMLTLLPHYYNWQFAFLRAFHSYFARPLDVEKWWSLHLAHFTGRELAQTWSKEESWQKFNDIIRSAVDVRLQTNDLPLRVQAPLQTILREWDSARQVQALETKLHEMQAVRLRLVPELATLADEYCRTIDAYLQNREVASSAPSSGKKASQRGTGETIQHLDNLDSRLWMLKPAPKPNPIAQAAP